MGYRHRLKVIDPIVCLSMLIFSHGYSSMLYKEPQLKKNPKRRHTTGPEPPSIIISNPFQDLNPQNSNSLSIINE